MTNKKFRLGKTKTGKKLTLKELEKRLNLIELALRDTRKITRQGDLVKIDTEYYGYKTDHKLDNELFEEVEEE